MESTIYCEKHRKVHQILCYPCLDRQYSQFHCISFGYNNGNNSELFILAPVTISKSTLDFTLNSGYNIVVSGCGEAWYRAWFGSKRPGVRIPTLRPKMSPYRAHLFVFLKQSDLLAKSARSITLKQASWSADQLACNSVYTKVCFAFLSHDDA